MTAPHAHKCTVHVIRRKPGGLTELAPCGKIAVVQRDNSDGKGFYCAEHARQLLPKPAGRCVTRGA